MTYTALCLPYIKLGSKCFTQIEKDARTGTGPRTCAHTHTHTHTHTHMHTDTDT